MMNCRRFRSPETERARLYGLGACLVVSMLASATPASDGGAAPIDWRTSPLDLDLRGMNGEHYVFRCPPGKPSAARITGSGPYTDASSICDAAVHAGALRARDGGEVAIVILPGRDHYIGSERNALRSAGYEGYWSGSFDVLPAQRIGAMNGERP